MYTWSTMSVTLALALISLPGLMTAMQLKDWNRVSYTDFGGRMTLKGTGQPSYLMLNKIDGDVYIGGNETLIRLYLSDGNISMYEKKLETTPGSISRVLTCAQVHPNDIETVCWNFIRVVELTLSGTLLVCGTNADERLCYRCDISDKSDFNCTAGTETATLKLVPQTPSIRPSSTIFGDKVFASSTDKDPTFQRFSVPDIGDPTLDLDTVTTLAKIISADAVFVGKPFEYYDADSGFTYVFVFYREEALEYSNHGRKIYSRLGRACKDDPGDKTGARKLASFIKARVNCSLHDTLLPFYYDEIQDMVYDNNTKEVYAVFTSQELGPKASALCRYRMEDISKFFNTGEFKGQLGNDPNKIWLRLRPTPTPRPGSCTPEHTLDYPPLLNLAIPNYPLHSTGELSTIVSSEPFLYVEDVRFTALAVDIFNDGCFFFMGTSIGTVIQAYKVNCTNTTETIKTVELIDMGISNDINGLEILEKDSTKRLVISSEDVLAEFPLTTDCSARTEMECEIVHGPYCKECDFENDKVIDRVFKQPAVDQVTSCENNMVVLYCEVDKFTIESSGSPTLTWTKDDDSMFFEEKNYLGTITTLSPTLVEMEVSVLKGSSDGTYICTHEFDGRSLTKNVTVISQDCYSEDSLQERCDTHLELKKESDSLMEDYNGKNTCTVQVRSCDTCEYGSSATGQPIE